MKSLDFFCIIGYSEREVQQKEGIAMNQLGTDEPLRALSLRLLLRLLALGLWALVLAKWGSVLMGVLLPFLAALLLAWMVNPLIRALQRRFGGTRRAWAVASTAVIMVLLAAAISVAVYVVYEQVRAFLADWPGVLTSFLASLQETFERITARLGLRQEARAALESGLRWAMEKLTAWLSAWDPPVLESAGNILTVTANVIITIAVFVLASCYIMSDYPRFRLFLSEHLPQGLLDGLGKVRTAAKSAIGGYFKAQFILSAGVALICFVVLLALRKPFAALVAVLIGVVDFVPIFGSGTILVPWALVGLLSGEYTQAIVLLVLSGALFLLRKLAEPRVVGGQTGLSTLLSLVCIYVGMRLGGVVGMIVAPMLCMMVRDLYRLGMFDHALRDCVAFSRRISAILSG